MGAFKGSRSRAMTTGAPVIWRPATSEGPGILLPASMDFPQPLPGIASGPVKSFRAIVDIPKPIRMESKVGVKHGLGKKRLTKKRYARTRRRHDRIWQRVALMERLKPQ